MEPFAIKLGIGAGGPQILQGEIDLVAQRRVALPDADAERLDAEQLANDLNVGVILGEALQDVEAAGQRVDAVRAPARRYCSP